MAPMGGRAERLTLLATAFCQSAPWVPAPPTLANEPSEVRKACERLRTCFWR